MSQFRQSDAKNHLPPRFHTKMHLCDPVSQPDATGYSVPEPEAIKADLIKAVTSTLARDFVAEHSSSGAAADPVNGSIRIHVAMASKNAQA
jgi:hypothetical protein